MEAYQQLDREWAVFNGLNPAGMVVCSSGTAALHLAVESLRLPPGSQVIVPDFAMVACARAVALAGLSPVFVDCREDLLVDPDAVDAACSRAGGRIKALICVHIYGRRVGMDSLALLAQKHDLAVVEDLAEAHGVGPHPGTEAACWSFYRNKVIAGEEGGAVAFRDPAKADLARQLRSLGFTPEHDFMHLPGGHNYRLANCLAERVLSSLKTYPGNLAARRQAEAWYDEFCPEAWRMPPRQVPWVYDVRIPGLTRAKQDAAVAALQAEGIAARHAFKPMSWQPEFLPFGRGPDTPTQAAVAALEVLYLPLTPGTVTRETARRTFEVLAALV